MRRRRSDAGAYAAAGRCYPASMTGFWIAGIAINLIALVAVLAWGIRAWRQADAARQRPDGAARNVGPES